MSYATMDHAGWVEENNRATNLQNAKRKSWVAVPETLTPFQAVVMDILGMVGGGIYNAPINWDKVAWQYGRGMAVPFRDDRLATYDFHALTMLVFLCHEARIRCEVRAQAKGSMLLVFHGRTHDGGMAARHPNLDEAVAAFRGYLPEAHRVTYQTPAPSCLVDGEASA